MCILEYLKDFVWLGSIILQSAAASVVVFAVWRMLPQRVKNRIFEEE